MNLSAESLKGYQEQREPSARGILCHAPMTSMYFGHGGQVMSCCANRFNPLGHYPRQSVKEIWQGAVLKKMRQQMTTSQMSDGCHLCEAPLAAGNYKGLIAADFDALAKSIKKDSPLKKLTNFLTQKETEIYPLQFEFELHNTCNLECIMCNSTFSSSIRKNRDGLEDLPMKYDSAFVEQLKEYMPTLQRAKFYGGEPFLIPVYQEIWDAMIEINPSIHITITTNGTVFNQKVRRTLEKLNCNLVVSLDSVVKETYETIRKNANFDRVMENYRSLKEIITKRGGKLSVACCPMTVNAREIPEYVQWCNKEGVDLGFNIVNTPQGLSLQSLTGVELGNLVSFYDSFQFDDLGGISAYNIQKFYDYSNQLRFWAENALKRESAPNFTDAEKLLEDEHDPLGRAILLSYLNPHDQAEKGSTVFRGFLEKADNKLGFLDEYLAHAIRIYSIINGLPHAEEAKIHVKRRRFLDEFVSQLPDLDTLINHLMVHAPLNLAWGFHHYSHEELIRQTESFAAIHDLNIP